MSSRGRDSEALPLLAPGSHSSTPTPSRIRHRNASFETGFPLIVAETEPEADATSKLDDRPPIAMPAAIARWLAAAAASAPLTLTLLMSAVGAGTLAVPYTFVLLEPVPAMLTLAVVGIAMGVTADVILRVHVAMALAETSAPQQERSATYQTLALACGGPRLAQLAGGLTAVAVFGACVGCVRVVRDMAPTLVGLVTTTPPTDTTAALTTWVVFLAVGLPLGGLARNISALRFSSYLGFVFTLYLVGAVVFRAATVPHYADEGHEAADTHETSILWRVAEVVGIYNFTFMLHLNVIPLVVQLVAADVKKRQTQQVSLGVSGSITLSTIESTDAYPLALRQAESVMRVHLALAISACVALYALFGVSAAAIYGRATQGNILLNLAHDPIMAVPRVAILFTILFSFPLLFHPLRGLVLDTHPWCQRGGLPVQLAISAALLTAQILCALHVPGIQVVFSFVGASILLALCYLLPTAFYARLFPWRSARSSRIRLGLLLVLAVVTTAFSTLATIQLVLR